MLFKKGMLSTEIVYYQGIMEKKKIEEAFQNIVAIFRINSIDVRVFVFISMASRICSHSLSILCAIIVVFSTKIY